jgi:hypothetical protein
MKPSILKSIIGMYMSTFVTYVNKLGKIGDHHQD